MSDYVYSRQDGPFLLRGTGDTPITVDPNVGTVPMRVAPVGTFGLVTTGAESVPVTAPADAQQVFRYRLIPSETATIIDQSPNALNATTTQVFNTTAIYAATGQPAGAYGFNFFGVNISADRAHFTIPNNAKFGQSRTRFVIGLRPYAVGDFTQSNLTIIRAQTSGNVWSLVRGLDNSLIFGPGAPEATTALVIKNFFVDDVHTVVEVEFDGQEVRIYNNGVLVSDDYVLPTVLNWSAALLRVGNQGTAGGSPFWGHMSHLACYVGDLTEGEIRWIRDIAKSMIETSPKLLAVPTPPAPRPTGQLTVTRSPAFNVKLYSLQNIPINFRNGRASDNLGGPIAHSFSLTLGGVSVKPARGFTLVPAAVGDLILTDLFDNSIHPQQTAVAVLPILQAYPALSETEIKTRLGGIGNPYLDNFDAGFPNDGLWRKSLIVDPGDGTVGLRLLPNNGVGRPNMGASVQMNFISSAGSNNPGVAAQIFRLDGVFRLIDTRAAGLAKGYVQTMFTFTNPYTLPRREIDFEFNPQPVKVGGVTIGSVMELTIHLAPNDAPNASTTISILFVPPESAFTGFRKWTIISNADRTEWLYEDTLIARYIRGTGFDSSVQNFTVYKRDGFTGAASLFSPGDTHIHPRDAGWHLNPQNAIIQQWMSSQQTGWIGPNTVPLDHPLLKFQSVTAQQFGPENTALQAGDWTATPIGSGQVRVNVSNYRPLGFRPTHLEYDVGGNNVWTRLAGITGNQTISGLTAGSRAIRLRPVAESLATNPAIVASNFLMNANPSDTKTVTVT